MATSQQLKQLFAETLSPHKNVRENAEAQLKAAESNPRHMLVVLELVANASDPQDGPIRQSAAVLFKNLVKKGWDASATNEDGERIAGNIVLAPEDRTTIKSHLVQLMCTVPPQIQVQLSESISLIAAVDYPSQWENLLPDLVNQFNSTDMNVVLGVLKTANSIFKRFRYVQRSDELYAVILFTLKGIQAPLLALFTNIGQAVDAYANDQAQLVPRFEQLRLAARIFYSLNYQDMPEFFEDHMKEWMTQFEKYLQYSNPLLENPDEETEPSPIDQLQTAIIKNLQIYADKDEEPFIKHHLQDLTKMVWHRLVNLSSYPKHDSLATTSIRFLSSLIQKLMHKHLFRDEGTLREIISKIVVPNLQFRESDQEKFEDDPPEFIATEVEGSDSETRRRCAQDLLRAMSFHFRTETTAICQAHVSSMLAEYASDPNNKWVAKDAAIHLMMGVAIIKESSRGVSEVNSAVNILEFFQTQILPELQDQNHGNRPVVKATSIKFVSSFRNQFSKENLVQILPMLIHHLGSPVIVVHTFAAYAIERILFAKEEVAGPGGVGGTPTVTKRPKISADDLKPFLEPLFNGLFTIIDNVNWNENDYVMKCVMRSEITAGDDIIPVTQIVITKLTAALGRVAKNPRNPHFNHYLFESIAVLVRSVCSKDPNATASFEQLLFEPFNAILQMQIAEFSPYVFQVLAQLLEYRPAQSGLGPAYTALFHPILTPLLWEQKGNIPALTRLLRAYVQTAPNEITADLDRVLGVFQKLISLKSTEQSAFDLLSTAIVYIPQEAMEPKLSTIFQILLMRLQGSVRAPRYKRLVTNFFALFVGKFGAHVFISRMDGIQNGISMMLLQQVWNPRIKTDPPATRIEGKTLVIGLTKMLCENAALLANDSGKHVWCETLAGIVMMLTSSTLKAAATDGGDDDFEWEIGYDAQYSKLQFASRAADDFFPDVADPALFFVQSLHQLSSSHPGQLLPLIQQALGVDPKFWPALSAMFQHAGLHLA